ncbi:hypothetical protein [Thermocatellispora tengchongensis]|uniref:hypothetical protein n=1 Tax=Thermocatellispora tengchongensis TaxID=1073253 RepID=UPI00362D7471
MRTAIVATGSARDQAAASVPVHSATPTAGERPAAPQIAGPAVSSTRKASAAQ